MKNFFNSAIFILFQFSTIFSQGLSISGLITDQTNQSSLPGATVVLIKLPDSTSRYASSGKDGDFLFDQVSKGRYIVRSTYLGYKVNSKEVEVNSTSLVNLSISLLPNVSEIEQVEIIGQTVNATLNGDTIQMNANAFKTGNDATSEDLVRKMPGIVITDGKVTAHGEDVKQIYVDGKPFFGQDPMAVLQNLPADVIEKVQVFDKKSDQAEFSGFDDGNTEKTINITTRNGIRTGKFGKAYTGYGQNDHYNIGANVNLFKDDRRLTFLGMSNNINQQNFSSDDLLGVMMGNDSRGGGSSRGGSRGGSSSSRGSSRGGDASNFTVGQQSGINTSNALGINYSDKLGKTLQWSGSYFFNNSQNYQETLQEQEFVQRVDSGKFSSGLNISKSPNTNHRFNARIEYNIDSSNSILFSPRLSMQINEKNSNNSGKTYQFGQELRSTDSKSISDIDGVNSSSNLSFRHRFPKRGRTIQLGVEASYNSRDGYTQSQNWITYPPDSIVGSNIVKKNTDLYTDVNTGSTTLGSNLEYTEPLSEFSQLQFQYSYSNNWNETDREVYGNDSITDSYILMDTARTNTFGSNYIRNKLNAGYRYRNKALSISLGLSGQNASLNKDQIFPIGTTVERTFNNFLPSAYIKYQFTRTNYINLTYRTTINAPSVEQLQEVLNDANPLRQSMGNKNLEPEYNHSLSFRFSKVNPLKSTVFMAMIGGSITDNSIINNTIVADKDSTLIRNFILLDRDAEFTSPVNKSGAYGLNSFLTFGLPLSIIKSNLNVNLNANYNEEPILYNEIKNFTQTQTLGTGLVLSSNISKNIDFHVSYNLNNVQTFYNRKANSEYNQQSAKARFKWIIWKGFLIDNDFSYYKYQGLGQNPEFIMWNAAIGKKLFANQMGEIRFSVFDVLEQNKNIDRSVTIRYIQDSQTNVLTRFYMLSFIYNLKKV